MPRHALLLIHVKVYFAVGLTVGFFSLSPSETSHSMFLPLIPLFHPLLPPILTSLSSLSQWTPEGRRLVTGASSGEFTLWNGLTFNFETILQVNIKSSSAVNRLT